MAEKQPTYCRTCDLTIDLATVTRRIRIRGSEQIVFTRDGRCHSLIFVRNEAAQKKAARLDHGLEPANNYHDKEYEDGARKEETEGSGSTESEIDAAKAAEIEIIGGEPATEGELENGN